MASRVGVGCSFLRRHSSRHFGRPWSEPFFTPLYVVEKVDIDLIFTRVNRVADEEDEDEEPQRESKRRNTPKATPKKVRKEVRRDSSALNVNRMGQDEFVHSILRLGLLRAEKVW